MYCFLVKGKSFYIKNFTLWKFKFNISVIKDFQWLHFKVKIEMCLANDYLLLYLLLIAYIHIKLLVTQ